MREGAAVFAQAKALAAARKLAFQQGDYDQAEKLAGENLGLFRERGDRRGSALALEILGMVAWNRGHLSRAPVSIYSKIGVSSRSAATRYALDHHLA